MATRPGTDLTPGGRPYGARQAYIQSARSGNVPTTVGRPPGVQISPQAPLQTTGQPGFNPLFDTPPPSTAPVTAGLSMGFGPGPRPSDPFDPSQVADRLEQLATGRGVLLRTLALRAAAELRRRMYG